MVKKWTRLTSFWLRGVQTTISGVTALAESFISHLPSLLQLAGLASIAAGGFALAVWLGLVVTGVMLCLIGWAVDE